MDVRINLGAISDPQFFDAIVAHELGHLTGHNRASASNLDGSLRPPAKHLDVEFRADAAGVALLRRAGIPRASMRRMLTEVKNARSLSPTRDAALQRRIDRLPLD